MQKDAQLWGYELELGTSMELGRGDLSLSFIRDSVRAEFSDGTNVPRMTPGRNIVGVSYAEDDLVVALKLKDVDGQYDIGMTETATSGFTLLDFNAEKTFKVSGNTTAKVSIFAKNLLDEVARNHSSFVKNEVPLAGRNVGVRVQLSL